MRNGADLEETSRRSFSDLIAEVRQVVQNLLDARPRLQFLDDRDWPWKMSSETEESLGILTCVHNQDIVAVRHEHEKAGNVARALYSQTERRRRMEVYFLRSQLKRLLEVNSIVYEIEPMPDCDNLLSE
jgi:hypothetical protein